MSVVNNTIRLHRGSASAKERFLSVFLDLFDENVDNLSFADILPEWDHEIPSQDWYDTYVGDRGAVVTAILSEPQTVYISTNYDSIVPFISFLGGQLTDIDESVVLSLTAKFEEIEEHYVYVDGKVTELKTDEK